MDSELLYTKTRSVSLNRHTIFVSLVTTVAMETLRSQKAGAGAEWLKVSKE